MIGCRGEHAVTTAPHRACCTRVRHQDVPLPKRAVGRRAVLDRQPVPAHRRLRVPVRLPRQRARSPRAATSSGCAPRGPTRRASSPPCSTGRAGSFRLGPEAQFIPAGRRYIPGTNVVETTWQTPTGWLLVDDFLSMGPWYHAEHTDNAHRRTPDDWDSEHMLIRVVRCLQGELELSARLRAGLRLRPAAARCGSYTGDGYGQAPRDR